MVEKRSPASDPPHRFECTVCGHRLTADSRPGRCPACEGRMQNLSKPRT